MNPADRTENPPPNTLQLDAAVAQALMDDIFARLDVPADERAIVVETLMEASLAGYNSHGIMRIPMYAGDIQRGAIIPGATLQRIRETGSSVYLDAGKGLGPVAATEAVRLASAMATQTGVGCVSVVNSNDVARLGSYLIKPAQSGLIAIMMVNDACGGPYAVPWGGVDAFLSTNPIAAGIPWRSDGPILIDVSTSVVSEGKLKTLAALGAEAPENWLITKTGETTTDLNTYFSSPKQSALLPLGGLVAGYKGFALSMLVDVLAGALSGAGSSTGEESDLNRNGVFVLVIAPEHFVSQAQFDQSIERFIAQLKSTTKAPWTDDILIPGERAHRARQQHLKHGIPLAVASWDKIREVLEDVGLGDKYDLPGASQNPT